MARTFAWAGDALGIELFYTFTKDPAITLRQPRRGWAAETMTHVPKGAQWVSDEFILFLADRARLASTTTERVRAFFSYVLANGCVRFADEQHNQFLLQENLKYSLGVPPKCITLTCEGLPAFCETSILFIYNGFKFAIF